MLTIRQARDTDREAICEVHRAAVLHTCAEVHGEDVAAKWAGLLLPETHEPSAGTRALLVAEEAGCVLGFAQFDQASGEVEAVYTHPGTEKRGIGSALLVIIEDDARARGVDVIRLRAATSAERFYAAAGYAVVGAAEYAIAEGATLPCIRMEKRLDYEEPRPERRRNSFRPIGLVDAP